jgi:pyruvate dehydrogenase E2 component (dihydrolipoamide acetyltransferase)
LEVETDKATMDVEAFVGGFLRKRLANEGDMVSASNPVAILTDTLDEEFDEDVKPKSKSAAPAAAAESLQPTTSASVSGNVAAVPAARMLAKQLGIELSTVRGTGPQGLITKADVERSVSQTGKAAATSHESKARETMAALTSRSKSTIPHFYVTLDLDMAAAEGWRARWNPEPSRAEGVRERLSGSGCFRCLGRQPQAQCQSQ